MCCRHRTLDSSAGADVDLARDDLEAALQAPWDDDDATVRVFIAFHHLRSARVRLDSERLATADR